MDRARSRAPSRSTVSASVTDLDRSRRFYEEVLRFSYWWKRDVPDGGTSRLLQLLERVGSKAVY